MRGWVDNARKSLSRIVSDLLWVERFTPKAARTRAVRTSLGRRSALVERGGAAKAGRSQQELPGTDPLDLLPVGQVETVTDGPVLIRESSWTKQDLESVSLFADRNAGAPTPAGQETVPQGPKSAGSCCSQTAWRAARRSQGTTSNFFSGFLAGETDRAPAMHEATKAPFSA